jgi:hypothetical protein
MSGDSHCSVCRKLLCGRQRKYCSRRCKNADTNHRHQNYVAQQARGSRRKLELIEDSGGCCTRCGYDRNYAALTWHHIDRTTKRFELDMRSLSNRRISEISEEASKCVLLCANCHAEQHFPQFTKR